MKPAQRRFGMKLQGKVALVTGAGRGIGRKIAELYAANGATVAINYLHSENEAIQLQQVIRNTYNTDALLLQADVSNPEQVQNMVQLIVNEYGKVDILVNNAGLTIRGKLKDITESDWDRVIDVNLKGTFLCSKAVSASMLDQGTGCIVNISSMRGITGSSSSMHYAASKAGVIALTKCLALELSPTVRVNCIAPGYTFTDLHRSKSAEQIREIEQGIPLKRFGRAEDVAAAALFLASEDAGFITGDTIVVSGGEVML